MSSEQRAREATLDDLDDLLGAAHTEADWATAAYGLDLIAGGRWLLTWRELASGGGHLVAYEIDAADTKSGRVRIIFGPLGRAEDTALLALARMLPTWEIHPGKAKVDLREIERWLPEAVGILRQFAQDHAP